MRALQTYIQKNPAKFGSTDSENKNIYDIAGLTKPGFYLFTKDSFPEVIGDQNPYEVLRELEKRGLLNTDQSDRHLSKHYALNNGVKKRQSFYAISDDILEQDFSVQVFNFDGTDVTNGTSM